MSHSPALDKTKLSIVSLGDKTPDREYWLSLSPLERLEALELQRRMAYGEAAVTSRLQRSLEIVELKRG